MNSSFFDTGVNSQIIPLITVALPVYNGEKYLAEALDSILAQTFTNFELIVIDDGSSDSSLEILKKYQKLDSRVRLVARENRNVAATLNEIIFLARGEWFARMDQDDIALPQRFERQLQWLERTGADICGSWIQRFGTSDQRVVKLRQTDEAIKMEMLFCSALAHPTVIVRTDKIRALLYDEKGWEAEDYNLWERAIRSGWKMTNVPEVLLLYRVHVAQISTSKQIRQQQLTQETRLKCWDFISGSMQLDRKQVDELMKIFKLSSSDIDMNVVDILFTKLLHSSYGESRSVVFEHMTRLYFRVAASNPTVVFRWGRLNRSYGKGWGLRTKFQLMIFSLFRIHVDGVLFRLLKKFHVWRAS